MKKTLILLLTAIVTSSVTFAQTSKLIFFSEKGEEFQVYVGGKLINQEADTRVETPKLKGTTHAVRVVFENKVLGEIVKTIYVSARRESEYKISANKKGQYSLRFNAENMYDEEDEEELNTDNAGYASAPPVESVDAEKTNPSGANATKTVKTDIKVPFLGKISINSEKTSTTSENAQQTNETTSSVNYSTTSTSTSNTNNSSNTDGLRGKLIPNGTFCDRVTLDAKGYITQKTIIDKGYYDSDKVDKAKKILEYTCMSSAQIAGILKLISLDARRLELAKFAYMHTYDTENYEEVIKEITVESNKKELISFVTATGGESSPKPPVTTQPQQPSTPAVVGCQSSSLKQEGFEKAINAIKSLFGEERRYQQAKLITKNNCLSLEQIKTIAGLLYTENYKLDYIKYAYPKAVEKNEYYTLTEIFIIESNAEELIKFLDKQ